MKLRALGTLGALAAAGLVTLTPAAGHANPIENVHIQIDQKAGYGADVSVSSDKPGGESFDIQIVRVTSTVVPSTESTSSPANDLSIDADDDADTNLPAVFVVKVVGGTQGPFDQVLDLYAAALVCENVATCVLSPTVLSNDDVVAWVQDHL